MKRLGDYELLERVGASEVAEVFRARQRGAAGFERTVAIKRIRPAVAGDPAIVRLLVEEAKLAVSLSHPNIVRVFDLGLAEGQHYLVMELLDGHSLRTLQEALAAAGQRLPLGATLGLAEDVADALAYVHGLPGRRRAAAGRASVGGLVHRHLRPSSILIGDEGEVKLVDFVLGSAVPPPTDGETLDLTDRAAYRSPEQLRGEPADGRSDVYALGVCLWELLTGEAAAGVALPLPAPSQRATDVPFELDGVVRRATAARRADRPSAGALRDALAAFRRRSPGLRQRGDLAGVMREHLGLAWPATTEVSGDFTIPRLPPSGRPTAPRPRGRSPREATAPGRPGRE
ncbi:MAG: serine/threonine-protein kinase [Sandaracinaceae bacterium]